MSENEPRDLATIADAVTGLAAPLKTSFLKAMSDLLGGLAAIPAAKLRQYAQGIEDTTSGRSIAAALLASRASETALSDPVLTQAAAEIYLPTIVRKAQNRIAVAQFAAEQILDSEVESSESLPPDDDWMNTFLRFAEDASSTRLQDLFGRILAGQVKRPGAFALSTLRAVSELDQNIASDFSIVWEKCAGEAVDFSSYFQRGDGFSRWKRLSEAGLMAPSEIVQFLPPFTPVLDGNALWSPARAGNSILLVHFPDGCSAQWKNIQFTRAGKEIGSLLPAPDFDKNLREIAKNIATQGIAKIELRSNNGAIEVLFPLNQ